MFYGHAYVDYGKNLLKKQLPQSNADQKSTTAQLSDEPENTDPCAIACVITGISWGIVSLIQIISKR